MTTAFPSASAIYSSDKDTALFLHNVHTKGRIKVVSKEDLKPPLFSYGTSIMRMTMAL